MAYKVELSTSALKTLGSLDHQIALRLLKFLHERMQNWTIHAALAKRQKAQSAINCGNIAWGITA